MCSGTASAVDEFAHRPPQRWVRDLSNDRQSGAFRPLFPSSLGPAVTPLTGLRAALPFGFACVRRRFLDKRKQQAMYT